MLNAVRECSRREVNGQLAGTEAIRRGLGQGWNEPQCCSYPNATHTRNHKSKPNKSESQTGKTLVLIAT